MLQREFCIFVVLMIGSTMPVYASGLQTDRGDEAARNKLQLCSLGTTYLEQRQEVCEERSGGRWVYHLPLRFDSGGASPTGDSFSVLYHLSSFLRHYPDVHITLLGHSDSQGNGQLNYRLSLKRAEIARAKLGVEFGINTSRIQVIGKGEAEPLVANESAWGRQQNRRVDVYINPFKQATRAIAN